MVIVWVLLALLGGLAFLAYFSILRLRMPLEPALSPGDLSAARDPEYFERRQEVFAMHGYRPAGDFFWHEGLTSVAMRIFLAEDGHSYAWAIEQAMAGVDRPRHSVSVMSVFPDGTVLDTTSAEQGSLLDPPWFLRAVVAEDTGAILRRHRERREEMLRAGKELVRVREEDLPETIRRQERRLGEYQVEKGRMRLADGKLRFTPAGALRVFLRALGRLFMRSGRR